MSQLTKSRCNLILWTTVVWNNLWLVCRQFGLQRKSLDLAFYVQVSRHKTHHQFKPTTFGYTVSSKCLFSSRPWVGCILTQDNDQHICVAVSELCGLAQSGKQGMNGEKVSRRTNLTHLFFIFVCDSALQVLLMAQQWQWFKGLTSEPYGAHNC